MPPIDRLVGQLRRRFFVGEFLRLAGGSVAITLLVVGVVVLGVKLFAPGWWPGVLWGLGLLPPSLVWLAYRARRRVPSDSELVGWIDDRLAAGGLIMTLAERPDPRWGESLPEAGRLEGALPAILPEACARALAVPLLFSAGALALPSRDAAPPVPRRTLASDVTDELETTLAVLRKQDAIDPATTASLAREIAELDSSIEGQSLTNESWETVDALRGRMATALNRTDRSLFEGQRAVETLAREMAGPESISSDEMSRISEELGPVLDMLETTGISQSLLDQLPGEATSGSGSDFAQRAVRQLMADPARREQALNVLRSALKEQRGELGRTRGRLAESLGRSGTDSGLGVPNEAAVGESPTELGELASTAGALGDELRSGAEAVQESVLPTNLVAPLIPGGGASRQEAGPDAPGKATADSRQPAEKNTPAARIREAAAVPSEVVSDSETWQRRLRPRHRDVVRGYFGD